MAGILVVIDGLDDIAYPQLNQQTPLAFGKGESFRFLEQNSSMGSFQTTPPRHEADTMCCVLTLLGVSPPEIPTGRAYLEALAQGLVVEEHDMVLRGNFAEFSAEGTLRNSCSAPPPKIQQRMLAFLTQHGIRVHPMGQGKLLLICPEESASLKHLKTFPPHQQVGNNLEEILPRGNALGRQLARYSSELLGKFLPNTILPWGQAVKTILPSFSQLHGKTAAMITGKDVVKGIGKAMEIHLVTENDFTGETDTNLSKKATQAIALWQEYDIVVVHIGGTDEATHRRNPKEKANFITRIDRELLAPLLKNLPKEKTLLVTADHGAHCSTGEHSADPVGFWRFHQQDKHAKAVGTVMGTQAVKML